MRACGAENQDSSALREAGNLCDLNYLGDLCANNGCNASPDVSKDSPTPIHMSPNAQHRSPSLFRNEIERDPTRDAVRGYGLSVIAPT